MWVASALTCHVDCQLHAGAERGRPDGRSTRRCGQGLPGPQNVAVRAPARVVSRDRRSGVLSRYRASVALSWQSVRLCVTQVVTEPQDTRFVPRVGPYAPPERRWKCGARAGGQDRTAPLMEVHVDGRGGIAPPHGPGSGELLWPREARALVNHGRGPRPRDADPFPAVKEPAAPESPPPPRLVSPGMIRPARVPLRKASTRTGMRPTFLSARR